MKVLREDNYFYIKLNGISAYIDCEKFGRKLRVISSFTPKGYRGMGLASKIMSEVVKFARKNKLKIVPKCSFALDYCRKNKC